MILIMTLNHYIEKLYGVKRFSREADNIIKLYVDREVW